MSPSKNPGAPAEKPPTTVADLPAGGGTPAVLPEELHLETAPPAGAAPTQTPPSEVAVEVAEEAIAAWHNGKKITALWSNQSSRNSWIALSGLGWKKLTNANDSANLSMTVMAAHAEQTNATVNVRVEADGMVHEIYVW